MKNKKILSLVLAMTMCVSMLTGCGAKPQEEFVALLDEVSTIKEGTIDATATMKLSKALMDKMSESEETSEEIIELEPTDTIKALTDEAGNLTLTIGVNADYDIKDEHKQVDMDISLLDESMNAILDGDNVYIETDGLFDVLEAAVGEEVLLLKMFLGEKDYIKTVVEETEETTELKDHEMPDVKTYINEENVTKSKDGVYTANLGSKYVANAIPAEIKESLGIVEFNNSTATMSIFKDEKTNVFDVDLNINIENEFICNLDVKLNSGAIELTLPDAENVLDTTSEESLDMSFGMEEEINEPSEESFNWTMNENTDNESTELVEYESKDIELNYDFQSTASYALDFILETADIQKEAVKTQYDKIIEKMPSVLTGTSYHDSEYIDTEYNSYSHTYNADFDDYSEEIEIYLHDDYVSFENTYNFNAEYSLETIDTISKEIEEMTGLVVPANEIHAWINELKSVYTEDDWTLSAYAYYDDLEFTIYLWDGEEVDITVERFIFK